MNFTDDDLKEEVWNMGMRLRNRIGTWRDHPSYDQKSYLVESLERITGAQDLVRFLGVTFPYSEELLNLCAHFNKPGSDREYREEAYRLALLAYPLKES